MKKENTVIKKSISLSDIVAAWSDELAEKKGFGNNFSAYIAYLIRRDKEAEDSLLLNKNQIFLNLNLKKKNAAENQIVKTVQVAARRKRPSAGRT